MGRPSESINHEAIMAAYAGGNMGLRALAKRFGVSYSTVAFHSRRREWPAKRARFRRERAGLVRAQMIQEQARSEAEIDGQVHRLCGMAIDGVEEQVNNARNPRLMRSLAWSLLKLYRLQRETAGLTPVRVPDPRPDPQGQITFVRRGPNGEVMEIGPAGDGAGDGANGSRTDASVEQERDREK